MVASMLNERIAALPPGLPEDQHYSGGNCELVDRIALVDGAHDYMVIRSANGSEIILGPWRLTGVGDCVHVGAYLDGRRHTLASRKDPQRQYRGIFPARRGSCRRRTLQHRALPFFGAPPPSYQSS